MNTITLPISFLELEGDDLQLYLFLLRQGGYRLGLPALSEATDISRQRLRSCLARLEDKGLINHASATERICNARIISIIANTSSTSSTTHQPRQETESKDKESLPPTPPIKEKEDKEKEETPSTYVHACVREPWLEWLAYKQQRRDGYKTAIGAQRAYRHAYNTLAGCDARLFADIVAQSIRNEWQGLFPLHRQQNRQAEPSAEIGIKVFNTKDKDYIGW